MHPLPSISGSALLRSQGGAGVAVELGVAYGASARQNMHVYRPTSPPPPGGYPVVVCYHGGGASSVNPTNGMENVARMYAGKGYLAADVRYRFYREGKTGPYTGTSIIDAALDCAAGYAAVSARADVDASKIVTFGYSTGGLLGLMVKSNPNFLGQYGADMADGAGNVWLDTLGYANSALGGVDASLDPTQANVGADVQALWGFVRGAAPNAAGAATVPGGDRGDEPATYYQNYFHDGRPSRHPFAGNPPDWLDQAIGKTFASYTRNAGDDRMKLAEGWKAANPAGLVTTHELPIEWTHADVYNYFNRDDTAAMRAHNAVHLAAVDEMVGIVR